MEGDDTVFKIEVDLHITFVPPMATHDPGITLTRTIELPFPPSADISIYSPRLMEDGSEPMGITLKEIIWDMERQVFFARTRVQEDGNSLPMVPQALRAHLDLGWRFGSYVDQYGNPEYRDPPPPEPSSRIPKPSRRDLRDDGTTRMLGWKPEERSPYARAVFGAFIRHLAEAYDIATAVAMERTGMFFDEKEVKGLPWEPPSEAVRGWDKMRASSGKISERRQMSWRRKLIAKYHSLQAITNALQ